MKGKVIQGEHEWEVMGYSKDGKVEYCACKHCNQIGYWGDKQSNEMTIISWLEYQKKVDSGEVVEAKK